MNVGPAQVAPVMAESPAPAATAREPRPTPPPTSEDVSRMGSGGAGIAASRAPIPQEVVHVHPDTSTGQQILVYEFVDSNSGSLIFQVPSEQMLNLVQEIRRRLEQMAAKQPGE